jgi:hypothetical protein
MMRSGWQGDDGMSTDEPRIRGGNAAEPRSDRDARELESLPENQPGMPGPTGPAETTEAVGDPDASSESSATEGGAAAGAVVGTALAGPFGLAVGAALGGAAGTAASPAEPVTQPGELRPDTRAEREAAFERGRGSTTHAESSYEQHDPVIEEHAVEVPVVDALTGHGEDAARRPSGRNAASGGTRP